LHTFPGFTADELTPLPASLSARCVLDIVTRAQKDLAKKVRIVNININNYNNCVLLSFDVDVLDFNEAIAVMLQTPAAFRSQQTAKVLLPA
jgi:arginase family enzyme